MKLTIKDKALIRCRLDSNIDYACENCEIKEECDWGNHYNDLARELLDKLDIEWSDE